MNEREALLRAVCENPDDDTPRLVFADWLEEFGDERDRARAEFVRAQIALHQLQFGPERQQLAARALDLILTHGVEWRAELPAAPGWEWGQHSERGFVWELYIGRNAPPCSDPTPAFRSAPVTKLYLLGQPLGPWVPHLRNIRELRLRRCQMTADDVQALCGSALREDVTDVRVWACDGCDSRAVAALVARFGRGAVSP